MDNLKYYNDSLAHDYEMFMPRPKRVENDNIIKLPDNKTASRRRAKAKSLSVPALFVMTAVFVLAALCGNIFLRLQINEVSNNINDMKSQISELESQKTELEVEFERKISYSNIELQAAEMGMTKCNKEQVKYIRVNDKNAALVDDDIVVSKVN